MNSMTDILNMTADGEAAASVADVDGQPLVSICIPSYRGAEYLPATIESVLQQSYANFELWIVDDASPDNTADVVARFVDPRIHLVRNERNVGPEGNWNRCLEVATGKYYKLLPQDDLLAPDSLAEHVAILEADRNQELALVFGSRLVIDHEGRGVFRRGLAASAKGRIDGRKLVRRCVFAGTNMIGEPGNGLIRRSLATRLGPYDTQHPYMVDLDYWFRALACGDAYYTGKRSSCFRISQGSWSVALRRKQLDDFKGFVQKYAKDRTYGITRLEMALGFAKARLNTIARSLIYRTLFRSDEETPTILRPLRRLAKRAMQPQMTDEDRPLVARSHPVATDPQASPQAGAPAAKLNKAEFDLFAAEYEAMHEKSLGSFGVNQEYFAEYKISDVAHELRKSGSFTGTTRVLDFGAGCGNSIPYFRKHLPDAALTCLDVSEESLNIGKGNFPSQAEFMHFDGTHIPVAANSFDLAFSACVFHHIDHDEHVAHLTELKRVVRNDGVLMIFEHNPINPFTLRVVNQCPFDKNARLIRAGVLAERIAKAGFHQVEVRYRLFVPPRFHRLRVFEKFFSWLPLGAQYYVVARKAPASQRVAA